MVKYSDRSVKLQKCPFAIKEEDAQVEDKATVQERRYDCTLNSLAVDRALEQLVEEGAFNSQEQAKDALRRFRHAFGYRKNFPRFVDDLMTEGQLSVEAEQRVLNVYNNSSFGPEIQPFPSTIPTLETLKAQGYKLGLLCSGTTSVIWDKIHTLGLAACFDHVLIVPTGNLSGDGNTSKVIPVLKAMAKHLSVSTTSRVVLVGKRVFAELKAAKQLGMVTVRMVLIGSFDYKSNNCC
ncbi:hypothetical protein LEN26_020070 [Aphanomyces euteiches]|nr:hypothetical protein LEN26_020070 [Aphanomyces euteiches]KAH9108861.1 hypothetical protein AeMF1_015970 [Aphanomyces euteiches]KAH9196763.1 hypothetical protein AeNC1_001237 [Aphanomyces euteiches]